MRPAARPGWNQILGSSGAAFVLISVAFVWPLRPLYCYAVHFLSQEATPEVVRKGKEVEAAMAELQRILGIELLKLSVDRVELACRWHISMGSVTLNF